MNTQKVLGIVGLLGYVAVGFFPYLASGLMVPGPWLFILWAIWVVGLVLAWRTFRRRPALVLIFPPTAGMDRLGQSAVGVGARGFLD